MNYVIVVAYETPGMKPQVFDTETSIHSVALDILEAFEASIYASKTPDPIESVNLVQPPSVTTVASGAMLAKMRFHIENQDRVTIVHPKGQTKEERLREYHKAINIMRGLGGQKEGK